MNDAAEQTLKKDYYLTNFHTLAGFVVATYKDLLYADESQWYLTVSSLSQPAQCLFVRLLSRKGSTFRLTRLRYPEIEHIGSCAAELANHGLASVQAPTDLAVLLGCFTKPELIDILDLTSQRASGRVYLLEYIKGCDPEIVDGYIQKLQQSAQWVTINGRPHWTLMQLCFFGNLYQDCSEFVLSELGTLQYEDYAITPSARAFTSRHQIDAHWQYFECEALYECIDCRSIDALMQLSDMLPESAGCDQTLRRRVDRLRNSIARQLERLSHVEQAMALYAASIHPPARERRARILIAEKRWSAALAVSEEMQREPYNEEERIIAQRLHLQCLKAQGAHYVKRRIFKPDSTKLVLRYADMRVEEQARTFFSRKGDCFYTENTLVNSVLGLFIWDIVFHPVPGAFYNPFQSAPADFRHPQFVTRRRDLLDKRFLQLNTVVEFKKQVLYAYDSHRGKVNPLVRWQSLSAQLLSIAIERIPVAHWRALFNRVLMDVRENTTGFPDLALFPASGGYEFIEVKGPGDALQANQRRWMQYFSEHGIACRVVHIRYRLEKVADE